MAADGIESPDVLDELESHLRDDIDQHFRAGVKVEEAFGLALEGLGAPEALKHEFERIGEISHSASWIHRMLLLERDIVLPIKAVVILMLLYSLFTSHWFGLFSNAEDLVVHFAQRFVWVYIPLNLVLAALLLASRRLPLTLMKGIIFTSSLIDCLLLSLLCVVTGGYESVLYWVFLALIVRNSISLSRTSAILLNLCVISCYVFTGLFDHSLVKDLTPWERTVMELYPVSTGNEQVLLRVLVLVLVGACFLIESLLERQFLHRTKRRVA
jgi:hypothetical protein